jgi:hypothetical protein
VEKSQTISAPERTSQDGTFTNFGYTVKSLQGKDVCSVPAEVPPAERARWLGELSEALNEAHRLLCRIDFRGNERSEALELYLRIEAARLEVQSLQLSRSLQPRQQSHREWANSPPWQQCIGN